MARNLADDARVLVFVDGQNVHKSCVGFYGHGYVHPLLLANRVVAGRRLVGFRYYSGIHDPRVDPDLNAALQRRHALIRRTGGTVRERKLRYRWEWGFGKRPKLPDPFWHRGETRTVEVTPYQRAREKGIDLALGLDVVDLALQGLMDVAVIIGYDEDLCEVARVVHDMTIAAKRRVSVEAALFNERRHAITLDHFDFTQQLRRADFEAARDGFDYREPLDPTMQQIFLNSCESYRVRP